MGNFDVQRFCYALIINRASTRELFREVSTEAEGALWRSLRSVVTYAMRLFYAIQLQIVDALSSAASKIHISFDGWTTKGEAQGFFRIVAHFATALGEIYDLPIALLQLNSAYTGKAIAIAIVATLQAYRITLDTLSYFVLNNASNNDTTIAAALLFGNNKDAYDNAAEYINDEEAFIAAWRKHSALGTLLSCLKASNNNLSAAARVKILRLIKLVVTRWNLYYSALKRATYLKGSFNLYIEKHVSCVT
ncbi:hypothetical protein HBI47_245820 [Parastagonospora nodorum]|nr:hypothetical protein HBI47_245820 [Parastagonospora nodorum]